MKKIGKIFLQGFMAILPIVLTIYIIYWLAVSSESVLGGLMKFFLPLDFYVPGMGVAAGFLIILATGVLLRVWLFRKMFQWSEKILERLPLVKSIYNSIRDLIGFFDTSQNKDFDKVVMVDVPDKNLRIMGLVTREEFDDLPENIGSKDTVSVYFPMSYQLGGFTFMVSKSKIQPVDMNVEQALKFIFTASVSTDKNN